MNFLESSRLKHALSMLFIAVIVLLIYLFVAGELGIPRFRLEDDARTKADYICVQDINEDIAAFLFYDEQRMDVNVRIYENRRGLSYGYFFRYGGACYEAEFGIAKIELWESVRSKAFLSMNTRHIVRAEFGDDTIITLDEDKPFVLVMKKDVLVKFFDSEGNRVEP